MNRVYFYANTLRKTTTALMTYFRDLKVIRRDNCGREIQEILVPLVFGPSGKVWVYRKEF